MNIHYLTDLNTKLGKFAGFKENRFDDEPHEVAWIEDKDGHMFTDGVPDLTSDLNAQFKYLWPKLRELGYLIRYQYSQLRDNDTGKLIFDWTYSCWIYDTAYKIHSFRNHEFHAINKQQPALACALAVSELIDGLQEEIDEKSLKDGDGI